MVHFNYTMCYSLLYYSPVIPLFRLPLGEAKREKDLMLKAGAGEMSPFREQNPSGHNTVCCLCATLR